MRAAALPFATVLKYLGSCPGTSLTYLLVTLNHNQQKDPGAEQDSLGCFDLFVQRLSRQSINKDVKA